MLTARHNTEDDDGVQAVSNSQLLDSSNTATSNPIPTAPNGKRLPKYLTQPKVNKIRHRPRTTSTIVSSSNGGLADSNAPAPATTSEEAQGGPATGEKRKISKVAKACLYCKRSHMTCDDRRPCNRCISRKIGDLCCDDDSAPRGRPRGSTKAAGTVHSTTSASTAAARSQAGGVNFSPSSTSSGSSMGQLAVRELFNISNPPVVPYDVNSLSRDRISTGSPRMPENWDNTMDQCLNHLLFGIQQSSPRDPSARNADSSTLQTQHSDPGIMPDNSSGSSELIDALRRRSLISDEPLWEFLQNPGYQADQSVPCPRLDRNLATTSNEGLPNWPMENDFDSFLSDHGGLLNDQTGVSKEKEREIDVAASSLRRISNERANQSGSSIIKDNPPSRNVEESDSEPLPWNYTYSYARIYRHMRKHWGEDSVKQVDGIIGVLRPYFLNILHQRSDIEILQQERLLQDIITNYEQHTFEFSPAAILLWRRTGDIVGANDQMATLLGIPKSKLGRRSPLCIYELLDEASGVRMFHDYGQICYPFMPPAMPQEGFSTTCHSTYTFDLTICGQAHAISDRSKTAIIRCASSSMVYMDSYGVPVVVACCFVPITV